MNDQADDILTSYSEPADNGGLFCRGTGVAVNKQAALLLGPSGSGKSATALAAIGFGAELVGDDGLWLTAEGWLIRPETGPKWIEARGIGLLPATGPDKAILRVVVDLARAEPDRLPPRRICHSPGGPIPLVYGKSHPNLAAALCHYLTYGRAA